MRAVSSAATVQTPAIIDCANAQLASRSSPVRLRIRNFLPSILRYFARAFEGNDRKTSLTFNRRFSYCQTWRELELHLFWDCSATVNLRCNLILEVLTQTVISRSSFALQKNRQLALAATVFHDSMVITLT
jgi:hypothetical protein